ncbi:MAG: lysophospholipid acyltransferase family protein [Muribaculaceae bacterium]|nr:lysophospholipid acyltransferase family protein [Muribaculaceae bacterium]
MKDIGYKLLKASLTLVALLPLSVLYVIADVLYFLIYHVVRYRRALVHRNLAACFPNLSEADRRCVERRFYHNFADYVVETVKLLHISDAEMKRRMTFENFELIDRLVAEGRSVVVYFSHTGNWEWAPSMTLRSARRPGDGVEYCQVYRPLRNRTFDRLMLGLRSRFGSLSFAKSAVLRDLIRMKKDGVVSVTGFMSDQKPSHGDPTVVTTFLGRPTAFISGTETLARKLGYAVVYWDTEKLSRGRYRLTCRLMAENAADCEPHRLTLMYASLLQNTILRNPAIWLWTHNRWKNPVNLDKLELL